jgi:hypothetical protein
MINISVLLLLLPSSVMASEDKGQRTELTREERESRAMIPLLRQLVSKGHHLQRQGCKSDARIQGLQQEVDKLNVSNVQRLQVEEEALDLRVGGHPPLSAAARAALLESPLPVRAYLEAQQPRPVRDDLDSLIVPTTSGTDEPLGLMMNPVMSHLNLLVKVEAGDHLPPFCLLTQDLSPMSLERVRVTAGSATPPSTSTSSAQPGTRHSHLPIPTEWLQGIQEGILLHNFECQDVQDHLKSERQRLHRLAVKYGLNTNPWTAIILMIPVLLLEASHVSGFLVYDYSHDQLKKQTIELTAPKDYKDPAMDYYQVRTTELKIIMTDGDRPFLETQCLFLKSQEVVRCVVSRAVNTGQPRS